MSMRRGVGIWFAGTLDTERTVAIATEAEAVGASSIWVAEGHYGRDPFVVLDRVGMATTEVDLVTGVVNPYLRHPGALAASFATLDESSGGRAAVGLGVGARDQLGALGFDTSKGLTAIREASTIITGLLAGGLEAFDGKVFRAPATKLAFRPSRSRLPLVLGGTGPRMCALAGELADVLYLPNVSPDFIRLAIERVDEGARKAGRRLDEIEIACSIILSVDDDLDRALQRVKPLVGLMFLSPEAEYVLERSGLDPLVAPAAREGFRTAGVRGMAAVVPDEVVDGLTIAGPSSRCVARVESLVEAGLTLPVLSVLDEEAGPTLDVVRGVRDLLRPPR
jgi:5,10-methylenetetrahydromethanopterin reductase